MYVLWVELQRHRGVHHHSQLHPTVLFFGIRFLCVVLAVLTPFVDQPCLELRVLPASASQVLGLKGCATTALFSASFLS